MISIMAFPRKGNSYTECFYTALESLGVTVQEGIFAGRWLVRNLRGVDFVHLHWPSFFYADPRPIRCLRLYALFLFFLFLARWRGARIVWTVHNLYPHDRCVIPFLDRFTRWLLVKTAALFLVHGPAAEAEVLREFPDIAGRAVVIDHGHWIGYYPNTIDRKTARAKLDIAPDDFVFLFIGLCKPYKNLAGLIDAFQRMASPAALVIAGKFPDPEYEAEICTAVQHSNKNIRVHPGFVQTEDVQSYLHACDVVVAPYRDILTSGTAMLALSFGRPVVGPALGCLKDLVTADCGVLYDPSQRDGLERAMVAAMGKPFNEGDICAHALKHDWRESAQRFLARASSH